MNKNVCPNCGQLYDADLEKCPLCGTAAQVMESGSPFRKQRRAERKEAEQEARRQKNEAEAETEDDLLEEEAARKRE
jgi:rRNA maturation protein Nop10